MPTVGNEITDLDIRAVPGQGDSITLINLLSLTSTTIDQWTAKAGAGLSLSLTVTASGNDVVVTWSDAQAATIIGRSWRLRLAGKDKFGGRVVESRPVETPGDQTVTVTMADPVEVTVEVSGVAVGAVDSVNGETGVVTLSAADVGADPTGTAAAAVAAHTGDTTGAHAASAVSFDPSATSYTATDVQGAFTETDTGINSLITQFGGIVNGLNDTVNELDATKADVADVQAGIADPWFHGGVGYRPANFDGWYAAYQGHADNAVDVVVVGDSIASQDSLAACRAWPWHLQRRLNGKAPSASMTDGWRVAQTAAQQGGSITVPGFTTNNGTATTTCPGGWGVTMSNGQKATLTATMDGFSLVYATDPTFGSLIVRDGVGGTVLTTINCATTAKSGRVWTSAALTSASHTIEIESVGNTKWAGGFVHVGNRAAWCRVWNIGRSGWTTADANTAARTLDFIELMQPDIVILATGTNDLNSTSYNTWMRAYLDAVRLVYPTGPIGLWIPYRSASVNLKDTGHTIATDYTLGVIDAHAFLGGVPIESTRWAGFTVHPSAEGAQALGDLAARVLTGDPIGETARTTSLTAPSWSDGVQTVTISQAATTPRVALEGTSTAAALESASFQFGATLASLDTVVARAAAGQISVGSPLSVLFSAPDGVVWGGRRQTIDAQTGTSYQVPVGSAGKIITRNNAGASTQKWQQDSAAAIGIGTVIETINLGAGTVTHSADTGASLVTGSSTSQAQGKRMTAIKVAANTWSLTISG